MQGDEGICLWGCVSSVDCAGRLGVDFDVGVGLELVNGFCCLGGMLGVV